MNERCGHVPCVYPERRGTVTLTENVSERDAKSFENDGPGRTRTCDQRIMSRQVKQQLSVSYVFIAFHQRSERNRKIQG